MVKKRVSELEKKIEVQVRLLKRKGVDVPFVNLFKKQSYTYYFLKALTFLEKKSNRLYADGVPVTADYLRIVYGHSHKYFWEIDNIFCKLGVWSRVNIYGIVYYVINPEYASYPDCYTAVKEIFINPPDSLNSEQKFFKSEEYLNAKT